MSEPANIAQLRREADKARQLADAAFGELEKRELQEVAASLDREAQMMVAALSRRASDAVSAPNSTPMERRDRP